MTNTVGKLADPGSREGVETAYRCVIRFSVTDGSVELDVIGLSQSAVATLGIELSARFDAATDVKRSRV